MSGDTIPGPSGGKVVRTPWLSLASVALIVLLVSLLSASAGANLWYTLFERGKVPAQRGSTLIVLMTDKALDWRKDLVTHYADEETCRKVATSVGNPAFLREERERGLTISAECMIHGGAR